MLNLGQHTLGKTSETVNLESSDDQRAAAVALTSQAKRRVDIFTRDLDKKIYDHRPFLDAVQALAVNRRGLIRILIKDSATAVKYGHRLIPLAQRLTSFIEIRKVAEDFTEHNEAFLIADETGYALRRHADRYEGSAYFNAAEAARDLLVFFNEVWRNSAPDLNLQRVYL